MPRLIDGSERLKHAISFGSAIGLIAGGSLFLFMQVFEADEADAMGFGILLGAGTACGLVARKPFVSCVPRAERNRAGIPDIVRDQVLEIVAKRFEESGAKVISGEIYDGDIAFKYLLPDGTRATGGLRTADYEKALNALADNVFPNLMKETVGANSDQ